MENNYKNPFQTDEEDNIIIPLDNNPKQTMNSYTNSQPNLFNKNAGQINDSNFSSSLPTNQKLNTNDFAFDPMNPQIQQQAISSDLNDDGDPPLLQDIGIDIELIKQRIKTIITFGQPNQYLIESPDLAGPILITFVLGVLLLLGQKMHFSDIEVNFLFGNIFMYFLFNCMAKTQQVSLYSIMCFLGYSLLPMLILAIFGIFMSLNTAFGIIMSLILACWSSKTSGDLIGLLINRFTDKSLIYYPLFLFYINYALIIIF